MTPFDKSYDPRQNIRWLAWERKNRSEDRIASRRMTLVFVVAVVVILLMLILNIVG
jgi:hypothetical protein